MLYAVVVIEANVNGVSTRSVDDLALLSIDPGISKWRYPASTPDSMRS